MVLRSMETRESLGSLHVLFLNAITENLGMDLGLSPFLRLFRVAYVPSRSLC